MKQTGKRKRILDLPKATRPIERLATAGRENLTMADLLAILFGTGTVKRNALGLGEKVTRMFPTDKLQQATVKELTAIPGIGITKAARLLAAVELGQRLFSPSAVTKTLIRSPQDILSAVREYAEKKQEYLISLYINARNELVLKEVIGIGSLSSLQIEPREVFRPAFSSPCAGIILVHNHPSGDPHPSDADILFTKRIQDAGRVIGIPLLDHVIIAKSSYYSFKESGS